VDDFLTPQIVPRVSRAPQQTRKQASESVWASFMNEPRGPEDLRAAPKQGKRPKQEFTGEQGGGARGNEGLRKMRTKKKNKQTMPS